MESIDGDAQPGLGDSLFRRGLAEYRGVDQSGFKLNQHSWLELAGVAVKPDIPNSERRSSNAELQPRRELSCSGTRLFRPISYSRFN
ncbi:hypothetical protein CCMA1212_007391 [Trichoderma ghanense]|uniref:Uncharacterized protein n=1 Tax=Trichoderma ghanense TaxID=65468 RepID=A0ABY2GZ58_9HYPO